MYFDFELQLRKNPNYRARVQSLLAQLMESSVEATKSTSAIKKLQRNLIQFVDLTRYNLALLTSYAWPKYPSDKPLYYSEYPFAFQMFHVQSGGYKVFKGSRQISKSTSFACRQMLMATMFANFRSLYLAPRNDQLQTYENKFREIEQACRLWRRDSRLRQNLGYKEYNNGSVIEMAYALTSAVGLRGKSTVELLIDECQNFDADLELEVAQTQAAAEVPITIYAGTALTTDSFLEHKWSQSSMGIWVMRCSSCNHYNLPLPDNNVMDMIQPEGCCCAKCKTLLNVRHGHYVHHDLQALEDRREGYHIPQIIVPSVVNNYERWASIYDLKLRFGASRKLFQEVIGISTEEGEREITQKQLKAICVLGRNIDALHQKALSRGYRWVISAADWGGSDYNPDLKTKISTTVHVMMGICPDGKIDIIHFRRYAGMDYDEIAHDILENHQRLKGFAFASDMGVGAFYNSKIREVVIPERHLMFGYVGPDSALISRPTKAHQFNQWSLNRTESISLTYEAVRNIRIRCFDWEMAGHYLEDFRNLFRAPGERAGTGTGSGNSTFLYRAHPTKPNDSLMAVNYGYMLAKLLMGEPMFADVATQRYLNEVITSTMPGGMPGFGPSFSG